MAFNFFNWQQNGFVLEWPSLDGVDQHRAAHTSVGLEIWWMYKKKQEWLDWVLLGLLRARASRVWPVLQDWRPGTPHRQAWNETGCMKWFTVPFFDVKDASWMYPSRWMRSCRNSKTRYNFVALSHFSNNFFKHVQVWCRMPQACSSLMGLSPKLCTIWSRLRQPLALSLTATGGSVVLFSSSHWYSLEHAPSWDNSARSVSSELIVPYPNQHMAHSHTRGCC